MSWIFSHIWNFICAIIIMSLGYFSDAQNVIYVMWAAITFDLFTGLWASIKMGRGLKSFRMWRTVYKLFFSTSIVALLYSMDHEMSIIQFYKLVAWLISGFEMWSVLENVSEIVDWKIIKLLKKFMHDKVKEETGIDFNEKIKK